MKTKSIAAIGALTLSVFAAPAFAQSTDSTAPAASTSSAWYMPTEYYGNVGYSNFDSASKPRTDNNTITGRLGARFGRYFGVEGEATGGFGSDTQTVGGDLTRTHLESQYAGYVVGFLPVLPKLDLLARVGYGGQQFNVKDDTLGTSNDRHYDSVNYGGGAQYAFDAHNGVRVDYTRINGQQYGDPQTDVWSLAYVRKF